MTQAPISPEEARQALALIETTTRQMRRALAHGGAPYFLMIWGTVWLVGFAATHVLGPESPAVGGMWLVLDAIGALASFAVGAYLGRRAPSPRGMRLGLYWLVWTVYAALILYFARPRTGDQLALLISLFAMMGYVSTGLLCRSRFLVGLGLAVTGLIVLGYVAWPAWFNLWMAVWGGGSLLAAGVYMRWAWS